MVADYFPYSVIIIVLLIKETKTINLHFKRPNEVKKFTIRSHLKYESVSKYCSHRDDACRSNNTNVCGIKMVNEKRFYKDFENGCYLFLSNMCDHPENEYVITSGGSCEQYLTARREEAPEDVPNAAPDDEIGNNTNSTKTNLDDNDTVTDADALRFNTASSMYQFNMSFDYHICPHSCPGIYSPVCVNVNRNFGKYFKMFNFVNHCSADFYYCKFWEEFLPPPNEDETVRASPLDWSFCGAQRYLEFARFTNAVSTLGHYGWLAGDYRYSHIMEPHERKPGYG